MDRRTFQQKLADAYYGELYGIAFYEYLEKTATSEAEREVWTVLGQVEDALARTISALLDSAYIADTAAKTSGGERGKRAAQEFRATTLRTASASFVSTIDDCIREYCQLKEFGYDAADLVVKQLVEHEVLQKGIFEAFAAGDAPDLVPTMRFLAEIQSAQ